VFDSIANGGRSLIEGLLPAFSNTQFAYGLAGLMALAAAVLAALAILRHLLAVGALQVRKRQISGFLSFERSDTPSIGADARETQFAGRFTEIDAAMQRSGLFAGSLAQAWRRYRKTFAFTGTPPIRSTQRPNAFFYGAVRPPTWLGLAASTFVGMGLLLTFLGLVAALTFAAEGMDSADTKGMLEGMRGLLAAASSKFVTSIAGVGLSLVLTVLERILTANLRHNLDALSSAIELGIRVDTDAHSAALSDRLGRVADRLEQPTPTAGTAP
jgi:hypothetical protein